MGVSDWYLMGEGQHSAVHRTAPHNIKYPAKMSTVLRVSNPALSNNDMICGKTLYKSKLLFYCLTSQGIFVVDFFKIEV